MKRLFLFSMILLIVATLVAGKGRTKSSVRRDKEQTTTQIRETNRRLKANAQETARQVNELNLLAAEIKEQTQEIGQLRRSIASLNASIASVTDSIDQLDKKLTLLRDSYGEMLRSTRAQRRSMSELAFIFSSKTFTEAYRKVRYLNQFSRWREEKAAQIASTKSLLDEHRQRLEKLSEEKKSSMVRLSQAHKELLAKQEQTSALVEKLKKEKTGLDAYLKQKKKESAALDNELDKLIAEEQRLAEEQRRAEEKRLAEERRRAEERARQEQAQREQEERARLEQEQKAQKEQQQKAQKEQQQKQDKQKKKEEKSSRDKSKPVTKEQSKPAETKQPPRSETPSSKPSQQTVYDREAASLAQLTGSFEANKGKLPFPVSGKYKVVSTFGRQHHPDLPYVEIDNSGIDIEVPAGVSARAIFDGKVSAVFQQPGYNTIVMVRHGEYLTIYANLGKLAVKTGDTVKLNQTLGTIYSDAEDNNRTILHFEIRKEKNKLNPLEWVR